MPKQIPAIAILIPRRRYATETSTTSGSSGNYPPPGFDAERAKKPLPKEEQAAKDKSASSDVPHISIPAHEPTAHAPTKAAEQRSMAEMAAGKAPESKEEKAAVAKKDEEEKKKTLWQKVKHEAQHYWDGTKLLVAEVKISSKLALKMAAGYELTRREHRQVCSSPIDQSGN
jgi:LETM1 and EF-hand domain-containing protein 1